MCSLDGASASAVLMNLIDGSDRAQVTLGGKMIKKVNSVEHFGDGWPVVTVETASGSLVFQFAPGGQTFGDTAMSEDGSPVCR